MSPPARALAIETATEIQNGHDREIDDDHLRHPKINFDKNLYKRAIMQYFLAIVKGKILNSL